MANLFPTLCLVLKASVSEHIGQIGVSCPWFAFASCHGELSSEGGGTLCGEQVHVNPVNYVSKKAKGKVNAVAQVKIPCSVRRAFDAPNEIMV